MRRCILTVAALFLSVSTGWCATNISLTINSVVSGSSNVVYNDSFQDWVVFGPTNNSYSPVGKAGATNIGDLASDGTLANATPYDVTASWTGGEPVATASADAGGRFAPVGSSYTNTLSTWISFPVTMPASSCAIDFYAMSFWMTSVLEVAVGQTTNTFTPGFPIGAGQIRHFQVTVSNATAGDTVNIKFKDFGIGASTWNNLPIFSASVTAAMPSIAILGTNGAAIASGEAASSAKGTDFGSLSWGSALTNTFSITNSGNGALTVSGWTTNGAAEFSIFDLQFSIEAGTASNFTIRFAPPNAGTYTAAVQIANDSTTTPYIVYLAGTGAKQDQTIAFPAITNQHLTNVVGLSATASSSLPVSFSVVSGPGSLAGGTNLSFTATGLVLVAASQAGDTNWNAAANVTNTIVAGLPLLVMLGTNGAALVENENASLAKGTDFGAILLYSAQTNTLVVSNAGNYALTISGVTTSGAGAAAFEISDLIFEIPVGGASNLSVIFSPAAMGSYTSTLNLANNSTSTTFRVNLAGSVSSRVTWQSSPVTNATDGDLYTYSLQGFDPLGQDLSFFAQNLPPWLSIAQTGGSYIVSTVAGKGSYAYSGDGGPATNAGMYPMGICLDAAGNLYIADPINYRVRKVTTNGIISTYAGNGIFGFSGDGGPATNANLKNVYGLSMDSQTNLYLTDNQNYRVRKVAANGIINTFAGNGSLGFSGDGGAATNARMVPFGLYADASNRVWVLDLGNNRIRRVAGGIITTVGGNGSTSYNGDGIAATNAGMRPYKGQMNADGVFFFTDDSNKRIRRIGTDGLVGTVTVTTNLAVSNLTFYTAPGALALDGPGNIFFALPYHHEIYRIAAGSTNPVRIAGMVLWNYGWLRGGYSGDGGAALQAQFHFPQDLSVDAQGNVYVADSQNYRVRKLTPSGGGWVLRGTPGPGNVGATNITLYVSNGATNTPQTFTLTVAGRARPALKGADGQTRYNNAAASAAAGTDFGTLGTNEARSVTLAITNYGTADLAISGVATSGSGASCFSISNLPAMVSQGGISNFTINFAPNALGTLIATFALTNNGTSTPFRVNIAGSGVKPGEIGLNKAYLSYSAAYGGANPAAQTWVLTNKGASAFSFSNNVTYGSGASGWLTVRPAAGALNAGVTLIHTGSVNIAGLNAGTYYATNTVSSPTAINSPVDLVAALQIAQAAQTISFTALSTQQINSAVGLSATASSGLPVSFGVTFGPGVIAGATNLSFTGEGYVTLLVSQTGNVDYAAAPTITNTFMVVKGAASVYISGTLTNVYDGAVKSVTATSMPAGLSIGITYAGVTNAPSDAGIYTVLALVDDTNYSGSASATLTISNLPATVYLGGLSNVYDGLVKNATATTMPAGVSTELRYDGGLDAPSNAGSYTVTAQIADGNYSGGATGTMTIAKADHTITFPAIADQHWTNTVGLFATSSVALPVSFSIVSGPGAIAGGTNLSFSGMGAVLVKAAASNANYNAASVTNTINAVAPIPWVLGTNGAPVTNNAAASVINGTDFGGILYGAAVTNTFAISNAGTVALTISGVTTSGAGAAAFSISNLPFSIEAGGVSNFSVAFAPTNTGVCTSVLTLAVNATAATYRVNFSGSIGPRPVWTSTPVTNATDGDLYTYTLQGYDPNGRDLSFSAQNLPPWLSVAGTGAGTGVSYVVTTVAGNGSYVYSGDGGPATNAGMNPESTCLDAAGNLYIADSYNRRVRKVGTNGLISTFAGNGQYGFSGDGGPATNAQITYVFGLSMDSQTNLYLVDDRNYRVRKVTASNGIISTFAGNGQYGFSGDGGPATNARIYPYGVYADASNRLWVNDFGNYRIRRVTGGIITTVGGNGSTTYNGDGIAATNAGMMPIQGQMDANGVFFFADYANNSIRRIGTDGLVGTVTVTTNLALTNTFWGYYYTRPDGLALDGQGNIFFTMSQLQQIYRIAAGSTNPALIAGTTRLGAYDRAIGGYSGDGGAALQAQFNYPRGVFVDAQGNVYVADTSNRRVRKLTPTGGGWVLRGTPGPGDVGATNITLYVSNGATNTPQTFTLTVAGRSRPALKGADGQTRYDNAAASSAAGTDFGTLGTNESRSVTLAITNYGTADLAISGVATSGSGASAFSISNLQFSIAPGTASNFTINFAPNALGTLIATFALTNNGTSTPFRVNVAGCGVKPGEIGLNKAYLTYTAVYGGTNPAAQTWVLTNKGASAFSFTNTLTYSAGTNGWFTTGPTNGNLASSNSLIHTGSVNIAGMNAGSYVATNTIASPTAINAPVDLIAALQIAQATQTIGFTALSTQQIGGAVGLSATASSALPVSFSIAFGPGVIAGGTNLSFTGEGYVTLLASQTGNVNYAVAPTITNTFMVVKGDASVYIVGTLTNVYDGAVKSVTATSMPAGLTIAITYNGITNAPSNAGIYTVLAQVDDTNYSGSATATLTISNAPAAVYLGGLSHVYDGLAKSATATTMPAGVSTELRYDGGLDAPSNAGSYTVTGQIADGNYYGGATGTLTIVQGNQTITFPAIPTQSLTNTVGLSATASSGLPVSFSVVSGPGTIAGGTNLTFTAAGQALVSASQSGDANWNAAPAVTNSITVTAPGLFVLGTNDAVVAGGAAANQTNGTDFGGVVWGGALTNTFALTNSGSQSLIISGWTTNGAGASAFSISDLGFSIGAGGISNFTVVFHPPVIGVYTAALVIVNDSTSTPYQVNLAGTGAKGDQAPLIFSPASPQAYNIINTLSAGGGSGAGTLSYAVLSGPGQLVGDTGLRANSGTGTITVAATKAGDTWFASASATAQVVCVRSDQEILFPAIADQIATNIVGLAATAGSGLPVSFTVAGGPGQLAGGTNLTFSGAGQVSIAAAQAGNTNFNAAPGVTNMFNVSKAIVAVTLGGLTQTYDGAVKSATATTVPAGLTVTFTYGGVTNQPVNVGSYAVTGTVVSALYAGWTNGTLTIGAETATVYLANLNHTYDGTVKSATATTMPAGLTLTITYNGGASAPSDAGAYAVTARVVNANYSGLTNGTLTIAKQTQTVSFAAIADQIATSTVALSATASSGLPVSFEIVSGPGEMVASSNMGFTGTGIVLVRALQAGNANWESAAKTNTVNVSYAPATVTLTNLSYTYNGAARSASATTVPAGLPVTITYNGSATAPSNAGSYTVTGTVSHALYAGTNTATLTIAKASPLVHFPHIGDQYVSRTYGLAATSDSGMPVSFSVTNGPAAITGATNLSFSNTGNVSVVASDAGNADWNAAAATNTFFVHNVLIWFSGTNGQLIADGEAANTDKGTDFGNVGLTMVWTNSFSIGNEGTTNLVVTNWTTNGTGAGVFTVLAVATNVEPGGISNIVVSFAPTNLQAFTSTVVFAHNGTTNTPFTLCLSGTGVQAAALGFNVAGVTFTTAYGVNPANQSFVVTNMGQATCAFTQSVTQGAGTWLTVTPAGGVLDDHGTATLTAEASAAGLNVGTYSGTVTVYSVVATNSPQAVPVTMLITQAMANVSLGALWQVYDGNARTVTVSTLPVGLTCAVTYAGSSTAPTNAGAYAVTALVSEVNYQGSVTGTLAVARSNVVVNLGNMLQVYDGAAKTSSVSTVPEGKSVTVTYDGSATAPSNAGAYAVTALVTEVNFQGSAAGTLTISKSSALVYLGGLSHIYNGAVKSATATTMPAGLTVTFTYNGITNQPVNAGAYAVAGVVTSADYSGQANAELTIAMADQSIIFPSIGNQYWTNRMALSATASSGLPVNFAVVSGPGHISEGTNITFTEGGLVQVSADQPGDTNWNPAAMVFNSIGVIAPIINGVGTNGALVTNGAPASIAAGTDFGGVLWGTARTNVFALTNSGTSELLISEWITNGPNAAEFVIGGIPLTISAGSASNISVVFSPATTGIYSAALTITNNAPYSPFVMNMAGTGSKQDQVITTFTPTNGSAFATTNVVPLFAQASSVLAATFTNTTGSPVKWQNATTITFTATGMVRIVASQAGNETYNAAPNVTNMFIVLSASTNLPTPGGVSATYGTYTNMVRVTWNGVAGATSYQILRNTTNNANGATVLADVPAGTALVLSRTVSATTLYYDDYNVVARQSYYYWVRALGGSGVSALSYVGTGYAELGSDQTTGRADLTVSDMVFLPVNLTNGSPAGTVSYWLANGGPDALTTAPVRFDFYMVQGDQAAWMAYNETNVTLAAGVEQLIILDASARNGMRVRADLTGQYAVQTRVRHLDLIGDEHTGSNMTDAAGTVRVKTTGVNSPGRSLNDYDGDGKSDLCLYKSALGRWYAELSGMQYSEPVSIGDIELGWTPVPGDYDGDGITDVAAYEPASGYWLVSYSSSGLFGECWLGGAEFTAAQDDFDGDALTDPMAYREADGYWLGAASSREYAPYDASLGETGYQAVVADYDGDGLADPAVYNRTTGLWAISLSGSSHQIISGIFGGTGYLPVSADYDGDGLADPAVYAPSTADWQVLLSASLETQGDYTWWSGVVGKINGTPVPADYDGDGLADLAVYHQDTSLWELFFSAYGYQELSGYFGDPACQPVTE